MTRDTVFVDTPAARATSTIVALFNFLTTLCGVSRQVHCTRTHGLLQVLLQRDRAEQNINEGGGNIPVAPAAEMR
jgi:hypothetical protein